MSEVVKPTLIFVVGPTASGKSAAALEVAQKFGGEIINGDSLQVFKSLTIGTAKPDKEERSLLPHHLFDHIVDGENYTAGDYRREALAVLELPMISGLDRAPKIVVGGSGFYIQALEKGMFEVPDVPDSVVEELKASLRERGNESLYAELKELDPEAAMGIKVQDSYRILRSLGVMRVQPKKISDIRKEFEAHRDRLEDRFQLLKIGIHQDRENLRERVTRRLQIMHDLGWKNEVEELLAKGLQNWAPMNSVGYKEMVGWLSGELSADQRDAEIIKNTMKLAKRQMTWFRRDQQIQWFGGEEVLKKLPTVVEKFLRPPVR